MDHSDAEHNAALDSVTEIPGWLVAGGSRPSLGTTRVVELEELSADGFSTESFWRDRSYGRRSIELARLVRAGLVG